MMNKQELLNNITVILAAILACIIFINIFGFMNGSISTSCKTNTRIGKYWITGWGFQLTCPIEPIEEPLI